MMPLWMIAMLPEQSRWGWAFTASGAPWVGQRVWPMPEPMPQSAAILQARQAREQRRQRVGGSNDPDDAAHELKPTRGPGSPFSDELMHRESAQARDELVNESPVERFDHDAYHRLSAGWSNQQSHVGTVHV